MLAYRATPSDEDTVLYIIEKLCLQVMIMIMFPFAVRLSVRLFVPPSVRLSVCLSVRPYVRLSVFLSTEPIHKKVCRGLGLERRKNSFNFGADFRVWVDPGFPSAPLSRSAWHAHLFLEEYHKHMCKIQLFKPFSGTDEHFHWLVSVFLTFPRSPYKMFHSLLSQCLFGETGAALQFWVSYSWFWQLHGVSIRYWLQNCSYFSTMVPYFSVFHYYFLSPPLIDLTEGRDARWWLLLLF